MVRLIHDGGDLYLPYVGIAVSPAEERAEEKKVKHPGFKKVQKKIAKKYGMRAAGAILASKTRHASKAAKKRNPRLRKVK